MGEPVWTRKHAGWVTTVGNTGRERALFGSGSISSVGTDVAAIAALGVAAVVLYKMFAASKPSAPAAIAGDVGVCAAGLATWTG